MKKSLLLCLLSFGVISSVTACGGRLPPSDPKPTAAPSTAPTDAPNPQPTKEPTSNEPTVPDNAVDIRVLSYNVWGIPNILGYRVTKDQDARFAKIGPALKGFDIINLQETFSEKADAVLEASGYPYTVRYDNSGGVNLGSGLASLSKYQIKSKKFKKFTQCTGSDCYANKGIFFMRVNVPKLGDVDIYNTHYQAIDNKKAEDIRVWANKDFQDFIKENEVGNPTIMTGDFNFPNYDSTDSSSRAYADFIRKFNPIDVYRKKNPQQNGFTSDPTMNSYVNKNDKPQRLDYVFILPATRGVSTQKIKYTVEVIDSRVHYTQPVDNLFMSDHFGVASTIRFNIE